MDRNILKVTLFDEGSPGSGGSDWSNCYPAHISIDINNGLVIDSSFVDYSDPTVPKFQSIAGSQGESIITNPRFYTTEDGYLQREFSTGNLGFIDTKISIDGKILNKDTTKIYFNYSPDDFRYFDNPDGTVGALMVSKTFNWTKREMKYLKYDKSLNLIDSSDLSMNFTDTITVFNFYRADNGYMITVTTFDDFSIRTSKYTYHLFDTAGNLVDKLIYYLREGQDNGLVYGWLYPMVDIVNKRLILTHSRQNKLSESTYFELFASDGDTIQRVKRIEVEGIKDHFRTQYATMLENGDILLYVEQFAQNDPSSPRWYSWINLDGQEMNIISSTKNEQSIFNKLKLYPNPTSGIVKIDLLETSASISITNINGQTLKTLHNVENEVDISELPAGMYIFDVRSKDVSERHKIVKVE
ncbi:MAG: cytochrome-c peroxidase [Bacteroidetes bacterium OLB9]|nr:MAG: cytochrome-c peroxidase [Bacteroidetes bacterium OLB9]